MKKLFANLSNKMRTPGSAPDSGGPSIAGYKVKKRKMEKLHKAAWLGDVAKLRWQTMCDDDVNKVDEHNRTALHLACANGHAGVVEFLLGKQAKVNLYDSQKRTALMKAVQCQNDVCVNILLENKADPNLVDADGNTALHLAAKIPSLSCVIMLVKKDADPDVKNLKGLSPLTMAVRGDHIAMTEFLLRKGADVNILDKHQRSPLMVAAGNGQMDMVQMLLSCKADWTLKDDKGLSAEDYALVNGHRPCALLITEHAKKRNPVDSPVVCDETLKSEQGHSSGARQTWGGPSTSKDGIYSPECVETRAGYDIKRKLPPKETDVNKRGLLLRKCEEESLENLELMEEHGFGQIDSNEDTDQSSNSSSGRLPGCKEEFRPEEFREGPSSSLKNEVVYASPKVPLAVPTTISPDVQKVAASRSSPVRRRSPNVIIQESDESDWDEESLITLCNEMKTDKRQPQEAIGGGAPEVSTMASDGKSSFHSVKQQQQETARPGAWDGKRTEEEEEEKSLLSHVQSCREMLNPLAKAASGEELGDSSSYEESSDEEDVQSPRSDRGPRQRRSGSEGSVAESVGKAAGRQSRASEEAEESPQRKAQEKGSSVDLAATVCTEEAEAGPCHNLQLETETPMAMENPRAACHTVGRASEGPTKEQPETRLANRTGPSQQVQEAVTSQRVESQRAHRPSFGIRPEGPAEKRSQFTVVSEARGLRVIQSNGEICRDRFESDITLSDLSEDDRRCLSAECLKTTPSTIAITEDGERSRDTDDGVISEDSDIALHIRRDAALTDSRNKKNLWDVDERCFLKANGHHGPFRQRLRQLEIANHILEQSNMESKSDVANLTAQLKMAINIIVSNESTSKKLEEDRIQAEMLLAQNHNTLNALHQRVNSQFFKQKEMEEECKRSKSIEEQLRTELEVLQADSSAKQRDLVEENEVLKDQVEDLCQELRLAYDNENKNDLDWNDMMTSLKYELKLANDRLEAEQQAHSNLVAEFQLTHTCLAEAERARSEMEKTLLQEKEERQRLASELSSHREAVNTLSEKLSKLEAHASTLESDVHRYEVQMVEKTVQLNTMQRESEQTALHVKELEAALQAQKQLAAQAVSRQDSAQEQLNQSQNKIAFFRQRLEDVHNKAAANEKALTDAKKSFDDTLVKLRSDCEERLQQGLAAQKELTCKATDLETLVHKLEQEKTERQSCQKQLQQELDDSLKKLSKCEASLEFSTQFRTDLEQEKTRLVQDIDKLKRKLQEKESQCIQAEKEMKEQASLLDEKEKEVCIAVRKRKEAQAAVDASNDVAKQLEEAVQRLELNNIRLEASAKQHSNKFDALQKVAQEDARMRVQLEDLVTNLQSKKLTLEDQLNKEVQKHSVLSNSAQDTQLMWEEELKSRSKVGLRLAEMEKERNEINTQVEMEKKKAEELAEQKKAADSRLEQEMKRNSELQKEIYRQQSLLKMAKRKRQDQQTSGADKEKLSQQVNELLVELEREVSSRNVLERTKRQLEEELLSLRRSQGPPPLDSLAPAANAMGAQCRCQCSKALSPVSEVPSCSVNDYLAKMRQDLDEAMSRELGNPAVKLEMSSARVSPVTRVRQQYANVLKKNHEV